MQIAASGWTQREISELEDSAAQIADIVRPSVVTREMITPAAGLNGARPGELGTACDAHAVCVENAVELTLDVARAGEPSRPVRVRLPVDVARDLALRLVHCAANVSCLVYAFFADLNGASADLGEFASSMLSVLPA